MKRIKNLRWWIAGLLALATALNYLDRQSFPVAVTEIEKHIPITDRDYSQLQMLFLLSYAVMYAVGGRIADRLGTRRSYALIVAWWSLANMIHGLVNTVAGLGAARLLLGFGEGGSFPCSAKAVSEWFSPEERAFAFGIFNTGSSVGAVLAPPLIALIVITLNWRWVFFLTGALGFVWMAVWLLFYSSPPQEIATVLTAEIPAERVPWLSLLKNRRVVGLVTVKFLTDAAWFFFIFWLPKYLANVRHLNIRQIGYYAWIPYAFAGAGSILSGWLSGYLIRRHLSIGASRKICLCISAALMPLSLLIPSASLGYSIALFSILLFGHQFWSTILQTLPADLFPSSAIGSIAGLMGAIGAFGAMLFDLLVGALLMRYHSYSLAFAITSILHPCSLIILWMVVIPRSSAVTDPVYG